MNLLLSQNNLYADNLYFCHAEGADLPAGRTGIEVRYSHQHNRDLPYALDIGWVGGDASCDVRIGRVRADHGLIPCRATEQRLIGMLERINDRGERATMEVKHG